MADLSLKFEFFELTTHTTLSIGAKRPLFMCIQKQCYANMTFLNSLSIHSPNLDAMDCRNLARLIISRNGLARLFMLYVNTVPTAYLAPPADDQSLIFSSRDKNNSFDHSPTDACSLTLTNLRTSFRASSQSIELILASSCSRHQSKST